MVGENPNFQYLDEKTRNSLKWLKLLILSKHLPIPIFTLLQSKLYNLQELVRNNISGEIKLSRKITCKTHVNLLLEKPYFFIFQTCKFVKIYFKGRKYYKSFN